MKYWIITVSTRTWESTFVVEGESPTKIVIRLMVKEKEPNISLLYSSEITKDEYDEFKMTRDDVWEI